ncbi:MAG: hypothetical protein CM15mP49_04880 [Actinomycetota bacterium]|nr:MAG: hypothetical protein CM15mP49_04880 [Actinomycetota bacterium]
MFALMLNYGEKGCQIKLRCTGRMETAMLDGLLSHEEIAPGIEALPTGITNLLALQK